MVWGGEKAGVAAKGKDVDRRSVASEPANLTGRMLTVLARPDGFSKL